MSAKYFSSPLGGRICPDMVSPVRRLKRLICEWPHINVVGTGQIIVLWRSEEAKSVFEDVEDTLCEDTPTFGGLALENGEDKFLSSQAAVALNIECLRVFVEFGYAAFLQLKHVQIFFCHCHFWGFLMGWKGRSDTCPDDTMQYGMQTDVVRNHWITAKPTENNVLEDCGVGCGALVRGNAF